MNNLLGKGSCINYPIFLVIIVLDCSLGYFIYRNFERFLRKGYTVSVVPGWNTSEKELILVEVSIWYVDPRMRGRTSITYYSNVVYLIDTEWTSRENSRNRTISSHHRVTSFHTNPLRNTRYHTLVSDKITIYRLNNKTKAHL